MISPLKPSRHTHPSACVAPSSLSFDHLPSELWQGQVKSSEHSRVAIRGVGGLPSCPPVRPALRLLTVGGPLVKFETA